MGDYDSNETLRTGRRTTRRKRKHGPDYKTAFKIGAVLAIIVVIVGIILAVRSCGSKKEEAVEETTTVAETVPETEPETEAPTQSAEELAQQQADAEKQAQLDAYGNLGIVNVAEGGYLNIRQQPKSDAEVIGKLYNHGACTIEEVSAENSSYDTNEWFYITSGGFSGYVKSEYLLTGDEARSQAMEYFAKRAIVTADALRVRAEPKADAQVLGKVYANERYEILEEPEGWVKINQGYISADYVEIRECLDEARKVVAAQ